MADITSTVAEKPVGRSGESLGYWVTKKITPVDDGVTTAVTSAGSATVKFGTGNIDYSGAIPKANLAANDIVKLQFMDYEDTDGGAGFSTSADTFDMTVATAALTAGAFTVMINIVDLISE